MKDLIKEAKLFEQKTMKQAGKEIADNINIGSAIFEASKEYFGYDGLRSLSRDQEKELYEVIKKQVMKDLRNW